MRRSGRARALLSCGVQAAEEPPVEAEALQPRIPTKAAARFLGATTRHIVALIRVGELEAVDVRAPNAKRASWSIGVASLRAFVARRESHAKRNIGTEGTTPRERFHEAANRAKVKAW